MFDVGVDGCHGYSVIVNGFFFKSFYLNVYHNAITEIFSNNRGHILGDEYQYLDHYCFPLSNGRRWPSMYIVGH